MTHIVDITWLDDAPEADWKINNKWKYYYMTYKETVILDTDMIFPRRVHWWDMLWIEIYGHVQMLRHIRETCSR